MPENISENPSRWLDFASHEEAVGSIYLHVPFCAVKCHYCAFYSKEPDRQIMDNYVRALCLEIENAADSAVPRTIFFGGGTPSLLNLNHLKLVFSAMERAGWCNAEEWTVECNPATLNKDKIQLFLDYGVNRISMGVQSMEPQILERLGRIHSRKMVFDSYENLRKAGFSNINLDLMFAIPGQTMEDWESTLETILGLNPEHMSCYELIYEEDTPFFHSLNTGEFEMDEDLAETMYLTLIRNLEDHGFYQYEVANFAQNQSGPLSSHSQSGDATLKPPAIPDRASIHNLNYWQGGSYLGLGPSANGFINKTRYQNVANTQRYCELIHSQGNALEWNEELPQVHRAAEIAAFGFRTFAGWNLTHFHELTGIKLEEQWADVVLKLKNFGWIAQHRNHLFPTHDGLRFADAIAREFLS